MIKTLRNLAIMAAAVTATQALHAERAVTLSDFTATPSEITAALPDGNVEFTVSFKVTNSGDEAIKPGDEDYKFTVGQFDFQAS